MQNLTRLAAASAGIHTADQIAVAAVPLIAAVAFHASPETIGILVACQSLAHLLGSVPSGLIVDRIPARQVATAAALISATGFAVAAFSVATVQIVSFGAAVTLAGFGIVLFVLASLSIIPLIVGANGIPAANSKVEMARALPSFAAPLCVGLLAGQGPAAFLMVLALLASITSFAAASGLPRLEIQTPKKARAFKAIMESGRFVARQRLLRPIALCAIFWNLAFAALITVLAPLLLEFHNTGPGAFGLSLSAFGVGTIAGAWLAARIAHSIPPNMILVFGPGSSLLAILTLFALPATGPLECVYLAFFWLGFGPTLWLIVQNSIRQLVTPSLMLGRVNAVIQTAIYGTRPLGALAGGFFAGATSPKTAIGFVTVGFACSFAAALFSPLGQVRTYSSLRQSQD